MYHFVPIYFIFWSFFSILNSVSHLPPVQCISSFRQACAIESAALLNPNWGVFVLFASPVGILNGTNESPPIMSALKSYPNIHFRNIDLWTYSANTPLEDWFLSDKLFRSQYLNSHISDFLRYVSLFKFGGTYLDLDVVVQKTFENISANYAGAESENSVAAGVLNFQVEMHSLLHSFILLSYLPYKINSHIHIIHNDNY